MHQRDQTLIAKTLGGDQEAFGTLVERYARLVHGVILHKVRRPDEVDDLVQEVFCKAYEKLHSLREHRKFAPWLARMASNQAQAWLRQHQTRLAYQTEQFLPRTNGGEPHPDRVLELDETRGIVWEALDQLPLEYRQVLLLYHFEDCSQQDIARFLDVNLSTVKWRLMQGRKSLRRKLEEVFALEKYQARPGRRLREKIVAGLPLVAFFQPARSRWGWPETLRFWVYRRILPVAYMAGLGVVGVLFYSAQNEAEARMAERVGKGQITVRLERGTSIAWGKDGEVERRLYPPCAAAHFGRAVPVQEGTEKEKPLDGSVSASGVEKW